MTRLQGDGFGFFDNKGADTLTGGGGDDFFEFSVFDGDSTATTLDVVTDFEGAGAVGGDALQLRNSFFITGPRLTFGGVGAAPAIGAALGTAFDGIAAIHYAFSGGDTIVYGDTNDDGAYDDSDFTVRLTGTHALVAADFGDTDFVIAGTEGDDTIMGTEGDDNIVGGGGNDTIDALGGNDRVDGGSGDDIINGGDGDDQGDFSGDIALFGGDGNDQVNGGAGNDTADGGNGNDIVDGGDGDDFVLGGADDDQLSGGLGDDSVQGGDGNDSLSGGDGADGLNGGSGNDSLFGGIGDDTLSGDDFFGPIGVDQLTGGAGADSFAFNVSSDHSTSNFRDTVTDFQGAGVAGGDLLVLRLQSFPQVQLSFGGARAMPAFGTALGSANDGLAPLHYSLVGGNTIVYTDSDDDGIFEADDFAVLLTGAHSLVQSDFRLIGNSGDTSFVIAGTNGNDTLTGTPGPDIILGLGGNDTINGLAGADRIDGGDGNDTVNGGDGTEAINQIDDTINGGNGTDILNGNAGNDVINGGEGGDTINGGTGRDQITGGNGNDIIDGGAGNDPRLAGGAGNDIVRGGDGNDDVDGDDGNDQLFGGNGNDDMFGLDGNDVMFGDAGNDELFGGEGVDQLNGGDGIDEIEGEEGADILTGGAGNDNIDFNAGSFQPDSTLAAQDRVTDFQGAGVAGGDFLRLGGDTFAFVGLLAIDPKKGAVLPGAGDGVTQLGYAHKSGSTYLVGDSNDDGVLDDNDFVVRFDGIHHFTVDDFDNTDFVIAGTNGDDVITGTEGDDRIFAAGGNDQVFALGGSDEVYGGTGNDLIDGGVGEFDFDQLHGEAGNDTISLQNSSGSAFGGEGNDVLIGSDGGFGNDLHGGVGDDALHAGAAGSFLGGDDGADQLFSGEGDDQIAGGIDFDTFELDGDQDLFVYTGTGRWSVEGSFFGDQIEQFEDGLDLFDLRGSGLQFSDLVIDNDGDFGPTITSDRGQITVGTFGAFIDGNDFLFDPPAAPLGLSGSQGGLGSGDLFIA